MSSPPLAEVATPPAQRAAHRGLHVGIDARSAAGTAAGRGRFVRELLLGLARLDNAHRFSLYARSAWEHPALDGRFDWQTVSAPDALWPIVVGRRARCGSEVMLGTSSYLLAATCRQPCVTVVYDLVPFDRRFSPPRGSLAERATLPLAVRRAALLLAISDATRAELIQRFPTAASKTHVVYPAADAAFTSHGSDSSPVLRRYGLERPFVLLVGTLEPRKNLPRAIEAFAGLPHDLTAQHELVVVGAKGWGADETMAGAARHAKHVRALGFIPDADLPALYRGARVLCYPSLQEGFGLPVLEALQCGTPVIASGVSSMPEAGGDAARYVDPHDVRDIRCALEEVLGDPQLRREMSARGLTHAARFSWDRSAAQVMEALEAAAAR